LRAASTEYHRLVTAAQSFRQKYVMLPGDITNATAFWGTASVCPGAAADASTTASTCNGDGNGKVYTVAGSAEFFRIWQHLANAGLIEGSYSGVTAEDTYFWRGGTANSPRSKLDPTAIWQIFSYDNTAGGFVGGMYWYDYTNTLTLGGVGATQWNNTGTLVPEEAWNIDTKMDDGKPGRGKVLAYRYSASCSSSGTDFDATYSLSATSKACGLWFPGAF